MSDLDEYEDDLVQDLGSDSDLDDINEGNPQTEEDFNLSSWTVVELKAQFKARNLPVGKMRKAELVTKLTSIMLEESSVLDDIQRLEDLEDQLDEENDKEKEDDDEEDIDATIQHLLSFDEKGNDSDNTSFSISSSDKKSIVGVFGVAVLASAAIYLLLQSMPKVEECSEISPKQWLSQNTTGLKQLIQCTEALSKHAGHTKVVLCYMSLYVFFQTFAVPGPNLMLSVLAGALFQNVWLATIIVGSACTTGAVCCYMLSHFLLSDAIQIYLAERIVKFQQRVTSNKDHLLSYMLFLRLTPLLPNWFINLSSPVVGIPVTIFATATFFGQMPMNLVYWFSGNAFFAAMNSEEENTNPFEKNLKVVLAVSLIGVGSLVPVLMKKRIEAAEAAMGDGNQKEEVASDPLLQAGEKRYKKSNKKNSTPVKKEKKKAATKKKISKRSTRSSSRRKR